MTLWPLAPIASTLVVHLAAYAAGRPMVSWLLGRGPREEAGALDALLGLMTGVAVLAHGALLLGALGLLRAGFVAGLTSVLAAWGAFQLLAAWKARGFAKPPRPRVSDLPLIVALGLALAYLPQALNPVLAQDDAVYHLALPKFYLAHHALAPRPFDLYANMPHLVEVLYSIPMAISDPVAAKVFNFSCALLTMAALAIFGRRTLGRPWAGVLPLIFVSGAGVQWHLGLGYVEPLIGFVLFGGVLALVAWRETGLRGYLAIVGVAAGFALASKYPAWFFAAPLAGTAAVLAFRASEPGAGRWRASLLPVGIPLVLILPWLVKAALITGNAIYPNLYEVFGGTYWSAIQAMQAAHAREAAGGLGKTWLSYLLLPWRLSAGGDPTFYCPPFSIVAMVLFVAAPFLRRSYERPVAFLQPVAVLGFIGWAAGIQGGRFLVALTPVMIASGAMALRPFAQSGRAAWTVAAVTVLVGVGQFAGQPRAVTPPFHVLVSPRAALESTNSLYDFCAFLDREVPEDRKVLSFWENRYFFSDREVWADSSFEAPSALAWLRESKTAAEFAQTLRDRGFSHVVIATTRAEEFLTDRLVVRVTDEQLYPPEDLAKDAGRLDQLVREQLELRAVFGPLRLYRVLRSPRGS